MLRYEMIRLTYIFPISIKWLEFNLSRHINYNIIIATIGFDTYCPAFDLISIHSAVDKLNFHSVELLFLHKVNLMNLICSTSFFWKVTSLENKNKSSKPYKNYTMFLRSMHIMVLFKQMTQQVLLFEMKLFTGNH